MRALLLAAGLGTRLRPITNTIPKCLVPILGRPLLDYWLELLVEGGITEILVNLHYFPEAVQAYVETSPYRPYATLVYEEHLLGTAGTLLKNKDFFKNEPVMLIHADNLSKFDFRRFKMTYEARPSSIELTMMTFETDDPKSCGIVELSPEGVVIGFHEKVEDPPGNLANGAVYIVSPHVIAFTESFGKTTIDFSTEVLPEYVGRINTFHNNQYHRDIGTPESYFSAQKEYEAFVDVGEGAKNVQQ